MIKSFFSNNIVSPNDDVLIYYVDKFARHFTDAFPIALLPAKYKNEIHNFIFATCFKKINERVFKRIKKRVRQKKRIKVLFYVSEMSKWCADSLYRSLKNDSCFEPVIAVGTNDPHNPTNKLNRYEENFNFFKTIDENAIKLFDGNKSQSILEYNPDVVFYQQPFEISLSNSIQKVALRCLTAYIPYGFMSVENDNMHYNLDFHYCLWRYFAENDAQKKLFRDRNKPLSYIAVNTGYPKFDAYFDKTEPAFKPKEKKCVIYAPHWSLNDKALNFATFNWNYRYFLDKAKENSEIHWIYKPHPILEKQVAKIGLMSSKEYAAYVEEWRSLPNAEVYLGGNYFDLFKQSDLMITDSISFLVEYLPVRKPIIMLDSKKSCKLNKITGKIVENYYKAENIQQIDELFKRVLLDGDDYLYNERIKAINYVMDNKMPAGDNIRDYLKGVFDL